MLVLSLMYFATSLLHYIVGGYNSAGVHICFVSIVRYESPNSPLSPYIQPSCIEFVYLVGRCFTQKCFCSLGKAVSALVPFPGQRLPCWHVGLNLQRRGGGVCATLTTVVRFHPVNLCNPDLQLIWSLLWTFKKRSARIPSLEQLFHLWWDETSFIFFSWRT